MQPFIEQYLFFIFQQSYTKSYEGHEFGQLRPVLKSWVVVCVLRIHGA